MNFAITRASIQCMPTASLSQLRKDCIHLCVLSKNKHFLSLYLRLWTLSFRLRARYRTSPGGARNQTLCNCPRADYASQTLSGDIHCVTSYNFIEVDLRSIVRPVDSRRGVVWVRSRMCATCVLSTSSLLTCRWRSIIKTHSLSTKRNRKL